MEACGSIRLMWEEVMEENPKIAFSDTAKKIWKNPEGETFSVIFRRRAAFYTIKGSRENAIQALTRSAQEGVSVNVTSDGVTSEILEASLQNL
jgi:hypothetical protein